MSANPTTHLTAEVVPEETRLLHALRVAAKRSGIGPDDALWPVIEALGLVTRHISVRSREIETSLAESLGTVRTLLGRSQRVADAEVERIKAQVAETETATVARVAEAVGAAAERNLLRRGVVHDLRFAMIIAGVLLVVIGGLCSATYWLGRRHATETYHATEVRLQVALNAGGIDAAQRWMRLIAWNDITGSLNLCRDLGQLKRISGREACDVPLWVGPPPLAHEQN